jgi:hypothetical protein
MLKDQQQCLYTDGKVTEYPQFLCEYCVWRCHVC